MTSRLALVLAVPTLAAAGLGWLAGGPVTALCGGLMAGISLAWARAAGWRWLLRLSGARRIPEDERTAIIRAVEKDIATIAARAEIDTPALRLIDTPQPNLFSISASRRHNVLAITTGLMTSLTRAETGALIAREIAAMASGRAARASFALTLAAIAGAPGRWLIAKPKKPVKSILFAPVARAVAGFLLPASRHKALDAAGARLGGDARVLSSAIVRADRQARTVRNKPSEGVAELARLYAVNPIAGSPTGKGTPWPDTELRVTALRRIADDSMATGEPSADIGPWSGQSPVFPPESLGNDNEMRLRIKRG